MINNIKLNKLKRQITDLIYEKHLNKYEQYKLNYFIEEYKKLDNDKTPFAYIALAKHYLSIGNINLAEENIKKAESINSNLPSISYLNFRINIRLENYKDAYKHLKEYEEKIKENNSRHMDLSIYYYLLKLILGSKENIEINNLEYINLVKIDDLKFKEIWLEFRKSIISKKYRISKELIQELNKYCQSHNILLNFDELDNILNKIINIESQKTNKKEYKNITELLNEAYNFASEYEFSKALDILQEIRIHFDFKSVSYNYKLIKKYINEQNRMIEINNGDDAYIYNEIKESAKINSLHGDNYIACQYYLYGIYKFDLPEFYFKVGTYYFSMGEQYKASKYFLEYIQKGGFEYLYEVYQYLSQCNSVFNVKTRKLYKDKSVRFRTIAKKISNKKIDINKFEVETYEYNEIKPIIVDFNLYRTYKKIQEIRTLYNMGYIELAETLYIEFNCEIAGDEFLQHLRKKLENERLFYIGQSKQLIL